MWKKCRRGLCIFTFTFLSYLPCLHTFWCAIPTFFTFLMFFFLFLYLFCQLQCQQQCYPWKQTATDMVDKGYRKTSNNGTSEKRTTSVQRTAHLHPIDFTTEQIHFEPPTNGHLSTLNNGHCSAFDIPCSIQTYLQKQTVKLQPHNADACQQLS